MRRRVRVRLSQSRRSAPGDDPPPATGRPKSPGLDDFEALEGFDPLSDPALLPGPGLSATERREAEEEAHHGVPAPEAVAPSPGERRVEARFRGAMAAIEAAASQAFAQLEAAWSGVRAVAVRLEVEAAAERKRIASLGGALPAVQRIETRYRSAQAAERELAGFRKARGLPDYQTPRPAGRGWIWLLVLVALAETTANGLLLHSASTEGVVANWVFAGLVTALNVGLLGWIAGDLIFRRMLHAGRLRRSLLALALVPCLLVAGLLHFGFAHYRDAVQAQAAATAAAAVDIADIDAGAGPDGVAPDPHPPPPVSVEQAVFNELRAQFLPWRPGAVFIDHPPEAAPDDHSLDAARPVRSGNLGYAAGAGGLVLTEDPLAGRFEGWRSVLLLAIGFFALALSIWKWFGGREPVPHFARLHARREATARALEAEVRAALEAVDRDERRHQERLDRAELDIVALGGRLNTLDGYRVQVLSRERDLQGRTAEAASSALEDYREANRRSRLSRDPPPESWAVPPKIHSPARDPALAGRFEEERDAALLEIAEAAERVRLRNAAHAPEAAALWEGVRERIAQAARLPGLRRRAPAPGPKGPTGPPRGRGVGLVPRSGDGLGPRLEVAS